MDCDNCSKEIAERDFYICSTSQVMVSKDYWKNLMKTGESQRPGFFKQDPVQFMAMVKQFSESKSNWAICPNCISLIFGPFQMEEKLKAKEWARRFADGEKIEIPGSGPAAPAIFLPFVAMAWKDFYGTSLQDVITGGGSGKGRIISHEIGTKKGLFKRLFG